MLITKIFQRESERGFSVNRERLFLIRVSVKRRLQTADQG